MNVCTLLFSLLRRVVTTTVVFVFLASSGLSLPSAFAQSVSYVRIIHASPYVGTADIFVDGAKLLSSFQFGAVTDYVPVPAGAHKIQIALVGKGINASVLTQEMTVEPGLAYTVAATGASPTTLALDAFVDNNILTATQTKVRVYQLSPDAGAVNVTLGQNVALNDLNYQQASNYMTIPAGLYTFNVTAPSFKSTLPLTKDLTPNTVTSIFSVGMFSGSPKFQLVAVQTAGVPGLPRTGSDPNEHGSAGQLSLPWLLGALAFVALAASVGYGRRRQMRRNAN